MYNTSIIYMNVHSVCFECDKIILLQSLSSNGRQLWNKRRNENVGREGGREGGERERERERE